MGLDMSVIKVKEERLDHIYAIRYAVTELFDWYLGKENKKATYDELKKKAEGLTREEVLEAVARESVNDYKFNQESFTYLSNIKESEFRECLSYVKSSIGEFNEQNSHLFFEWEKLPDDSILDSCSWSLRNILFSCADESTMNNPIMENEIVKLDPLKLKELAKKWKGYGWKMRAIKWMSYLNPDGAERMYEDFIEETEITGCDIVELLYFRNCILKVAKYIKPENNLWLVTSY